MAYFRPRPGMEVVLRSDLIQDRDIQILNIIHQGNPTTTIINLYNCCYSFVSHMSRFALSFYSTSHSFLPDLFPYIRLDCIFLCHTVLTSVSCYEDWGEYKMFSMFFSLSDMYLVMTVLGIYKYISFMLWRLSHDCSRCSRSCSGSSCNNNDHKQHDECATALLHTIPLSYNQPTIITGNWNIYGSPPQMSTPVWKQTAWWTGSWSMATYFQTPLCWARNQNESSCT